MKRAFNLHLHEAVLDPTVDYCGAIGRNVNDLITQLLVEFHERRGTFIGTNPQELSRPQSAPKKQRPI